jgi:hypothetical protein
MSPKVHPAITVQSHPSHQTDGGYFIPVNQREKQSARHRVGSMTAAKTVQTA